jgi:hypothetical protein
MSKKIRFARVHERVDDEVGSYVVIMDDAFDEEEYEGRVDLDVPLNPSAEIRMLCEAMDS